MRVNVAPERRVPRLEKQTRGRSRKPERFEIASLHRVNDEELHDTSQAKQVVQVQGCDVVPGFEMVMGGVDMCTDMNVTLESRIVDRVTGAEIERPREPQTNATRPGRHPGPQRN
jgi:high-affinity K+ transport system ATPase subunit B